ncbi:MAG: SRPBCC family protein [Myxococcota bacterium]
MTKSGSAPILGAALAIGLALAPQLALADASSIARRLGGEIQASAVDHPEFDVSWGKAIGVVDAPFEDVLSTVRGYQDYREFLPHFHESRVLAQRGDRARVYLEAGIIHNTVTLWAQMEMDRVASRGQTQIIEARMLDGNMERFLARWEVAPLDGGQRALVAFQLLVDPDLPLPASIFTEENVSSARRTIRALRRRLTAG